MNKWVFAKALRYSFNYMVIIILAEAIKSIGINSLYSFSLLVIPVINYLALLWGVMRPIANDGIVRKRDITKPFLIITTLSNILFFYIEQYGTQTILIVVITNIVEFLLMKSENEIKDDNTQQNIKDYFANNIKKK